MEIPIHFDGQGKPNNFGSRSTIALTLLFLSIGTYAYLMFVPQKDPKKNFPIFSDTYNKLRFILTVFISSICFVIISSVQNGELNTVLFYFIYALLISLLGNYMGNVRPNYFLGIRNPWTLKSEITWKKTHFATGRLWFVLGVLSFILIILLPNNVTIYVLIGSLVIMIIFPIIYSYIIFSNEEEFKRMSENKPNKEVDNICRIDSDGWYYCFYYNPSDSRIMVPKKYKLMGWTVNFGNPYSYVLIAVIIAIIIGSRYIA